MDVCMNKHLEIGISESSQLMSDERAIPLAGGAAKQGSSDFVLTGRCASCQQCMAIIVLQAISAESNWLQSDDRDGSCSKGPFFFPRDARPRPAGLHSCLGA